LTEVPEAVVGEDSFTHAMEEKSKSRPLQTKAPQRVAGALKRSLAGAPSFGFFEAWGF
jgi:hypothetical protein